MVKYFCDKCGKEACNKDSNIFIFPFWANAYGGMANKMIAEKIHIAQEEVVLCSQCQKEIADMLIYKSGENYE